MANDKWMNRPILSSKHYNDLELKAAVGQFVHKLPKEQAEELAYQQYLQEHCKLGAAHHLASMKLALSANDHASAQKHGILYNMHAQKAGFDPVGPPPQDVAAEVERMSQPKYRFKAHPSDRFLVEDSLRTS